MRVFNTVNTDDLNSAEAIMRYWDSELIRKLYFLPKRVTEEQKNSFLNSASYAAVTGQLKHMMETINPEKECLDMIHAFEEDTGYVSGDAQLYLILGCGTTTIYTAEYEGKEVSVLCMESLHGSTERLKLLLAHEYTHLVRKAVLKKDIFEECIGERLAAEGIAENYSREQVPGRADSEYCIVHEDTVRWVKENLSWLEGMTDMHLEDASLMKDLFYMFADIDYPVRSGYVYGYLAVKHYLERNHMQVRDILLTDWHEILRQKA